MNISEEKMQKLLVLYNSYVLEILKMEKIDRWCSKKTVTDKVLNATRTNEQKVKDAMDEAEDSYQEGDKIRVFFRNDGTLALQEHWNSDHDPFKLIEKLWKTVKIFETVVDISLFTKYHLKRQRKLLDSLAA